MNNHSLYWIGIRESELEDTGSLFEGSITIFGSGKDNNYAFDKEYQFRYDYNEDIELLNVFINQKAEEIVEKNPDSKFMLYYPVDISILSPNIAAKTLYANDIQITEFLDDKIKTRMWLSEFVPLPPFTIQSGENVNYEYLCSTFPDFQKFVIQADYSCGGTGTWLLTSDNISDIARRVSSKKQYTLMPYFQHCVSLNIHLVIYEQEVLLMPASVQIITQKSHSLVYQGSDFIIYTHLPQSIQKKVTQYAQVIGRQLQYSGYRGVCGIDFIATQNEVFFSEVNGRFQSSTVLINKALKATGLDISLQRLHIDSYNNPKCTLDLPKFNVKYSFYGYSYDPNTFEKAQYIFENINDTPEIIHCQSDDLDWEMKLEKNTYLFKIFSNTNIAALSVDFSILLQPNLSIDKHIFKLENYPEKLLELKIMLLSHGIKISQFALEKLNKEGGINHEEFEAFDLLIGNNIYINVPYKTKFSSLSPFNIELNSLGEYILTYFRNQLATVKIRSANKLDSLISKNGFTYSDFIYLGNDRLRISHRNGCHFKAIGKGCKFCDIENDETFLPLEDIKEAIDTYTYNKSINHFLIGGGSEQIDSDFKKILCIAEYLKAKFDKPINVMSIPPMDTNILLAFKEAGITEVTFNLEVYDRTLAQKYMPGKGALTLEMYDRAFKRAVDIWGKTGSVRTVFIVGLESESSLLEGIKHVCALGVSPILSLLKGINGTPMQYFLPPSDEQILDICCKVQYICDLYGIEQGPTCHYCEDNTLKISY